VAIQLLVVFAKPLWQLAVSKRARFEEVEEERTFGVI
jgi:hypothetical protein